MAGALNRNYPSMVILPAHALGEGVSLRLPF
jgi:hypothetical protein